MSIAPHSLFPSAPLQGPTPEFVRWSIDFVCPIREPIGTTLVEKTERYLWSLAALGRGLNEGNVVDDVCLVPSASEAEPARGCLVHEVANFYGGLELCRKQCGTCSANISVRGDVLKTTSGPSLAGCFGWLIRTEDLVGRLDEQMDARRDELAALGGFGLTHPAWYGLWSADKLEGKSLEFVGGILDQVVDSANAPADWQRFQEALVQCRAQNWSLSVQLVPAGRAEGPDWTIGPYCPGCRAPVGLGIQRCHCCGRRGHGHPAVRRKVIGQRPFSRLDALVGAERARELLARLAKASAKSTSHSGEAKANHQ